MQPNVENSMNVPAFLNKLWKMVNDPKTDQLICWGPAGTTFVIQNRAAFWYELLPLYYKHNNMSSFIRQLNMYGFHKIASIESSGEADKDELNFFHQYFQKDKPELLKSIKRKVTVHHKTMSHAVENDLSKDEIAKFIADVSQIKGRQQSVDSQLNTMKAENSVLWRELAILRQKHLQQQKIVNKLIQFLVTLVQPSSRMSGLAPKRHYPLMIHEKPPKKSKASGKQVDSPKSEDTDGPIIHELETTEIPEALFEATEDNGADASEQQEVFINSPELEMVEELLSDSEMQEETPDSVVAGLTQDDGDIDPNMFLTANSQDAILSNLMNGNYNTKSVSDAIGAGSSTNDESNSDKTVATTNRVRLQRLNSVPIAHFSEDMDLHVEHTQTELESLKDILNPLLSSVQSVDANAFLNLFSDNEPAFGLSYGDDLPKTTTNTDLATAGSELTKYSPAPSIDFSTLFDEDSSDLPPIAIAAETLDEGGSMTTPQILNDAPPPAFPTNP